MKSLPQIPESNPCGGCAACCHVVAVKSLQKPMHTTCSHQCEAGCAVYESRPAECRTYYCLYQSGFMGKLISLRPDHLGVLFDFRPTDEGDGRFVSAWEVRPGASEEPPAAWWISYIAQKLVVYVRRHGTGKGYLRGPAHQLARYRLDETI